MEALNAKDAEYYDVVLGVFHVLMWHFLFAVLWAAGPMGIKNFPPLPQYFMACGRGDIRARA